MVEGAAPRHAEGEQMHADFEIGEGL